MKQKGVKLFTILILLLLVFGIGKNWYTNIEKQAEKEEAERIHIAEKSSVSVLKNMFTDIQMIEFERTGYNNMTDSYQMFVKMTNSKKQSVRFSYSYEPSGQIGSYGIEDREIQKRGTTENLVKVTFSNKKNEAI